MNKYLKTVREYGKGVSGRIMIQGDETASALTFSQVCQVYTSDRWPVWQNLFEGRVEGDEIREVKGGRSR